MTAAAVAVTEVTPTTTDALEATPPAAKNTMASGVAVSMKGVGYCVKVKKEELRILDKVDGLFKPGCMTALMGPSGSGKTTLLDVVASRKNTGQIVGDIRFGGSHLSRSTLRDTVGYVEQFDTLVGELTVTQMLRYTAELRLPTTLSPDEKKARVEEVIGQLGLGVCEHTVIGSALKRGISGGQAKRVNIGLAMITRPAIIFLDEPTSGIDSFMANEVALALAALANEGRTVVCTIHSPTSLAFSLFDSLLMLKKGRVTYDGPVSTVAEYLHKECGVPPPTGTFFSLPEWIVDVMSEAGVSNANKASSTDWVALYAKSPLCALRNKEREAASGGADGSAVVLTSPKSMPGSLRQLGTLLRYRMATHYQSGEFLGPRIGDKIVNGILILLLYWGIGDDEDTQAIQSTAVRCLPPAAFALPPAAREVEALSPLDGSPAAVCGASQSLLYFISALCGYGAAAFVPSLTLDRPLFYRELADGCYTPLVYYISKFTEEAFLCIFTSLIFSAIVFFGAPRHHTLGTPHPSPATPPRRTVAISLCRDSAPGLLLGLCVRLLPHDNEWHLPRLRRRSAGTEHGCGQRAPPLSRDRLDV